MATRTVPTLELPRERFELACGAVLLVSVRPGAPVTAARVHIRGGPSLDVAERAGTAFLTGGMLDQGTAKHSEEELALLLEPAGGEIHGDANGLTGSISGRSWKLMLEVMAELLTTPKFPKQAVDRQKRRLLSRLLIERDDPRSQGSRQFRKLIYGDHWIGRPAHGYYETVANVEAKHLRAHHKKYWVAKRATIGVCGDVDPLKVKRTLDRLLAGWTPGEPFQPTPLELPERAVRTAAFPADRRQVHVYLGHLGIRRNDPDYAALVVMDHILGTGPGFTNRISRSLRDEQGLAYSVSADIYSSAGLLPGTFTAYIGTSPEHVGTAVRGFQGEIRRIQDKLVTKEELRVVQQYLLGSFILGYERASRRAGYLVSAELFDLPDDTLERLPREFAAITREDVRRVAREHLHPDACCLSAAGPVTEKELRGILG